MGRYCSKCQKAKPLEDFYCSRSAKVGYRSECKECSKNNVREWKRNNRGRYLKMRHSYYSRHRSEILLKASLPGGTAEKARTRREGLRDEIIKKLGGKCISCGFSDKRALQVDHINGGGRREMYSTFKSDYLAYYRNLIADTTGKYQLLCANCNWIKRSENMKELGGRKKYLAR